MTPGDRPSLPLEAEPLLALHAPATGTVAPSGVVPAGGPFALEEEPALWPVRPAGAAAPAAAAPPPPPPAAPPRPAAVTAPAARALPATGLPGGPAAGAVLIGLAALLRLRRRGGL